MVQKWQIGLLIIAVAISGAILYYSTKSNNLILSKNGNGGLKVDQVGPYKTGTVVIITAIPEPGWQFVKWQGASSSTLNPLQITINSDESLTATFIQIEYLVTTSVDGIGSVKLDPSKVSYHYGDTVQVTAIPLEGWIFSSWEGVSGGVNPLNTVIDGNKTLRAVFVLKEPPQGNILIYSDQLEQEGGISQTLLERPPVQAADRLGYQYVAAGTYDLFLANLAQKNWGLVIFNEELFTATPNVYDALNDYVSKGGRVIIAGWAIRNNPSHPLWASLGVAYASDLKVVGDKTIYIWDNSSTLMEQPNALPGSITLHDYQGFGVDGAFITTINGANIILGQTMTPVNGSGLIAISSNGFTIFNGINTATFSLDTNHNNVIDSIDIWENEIEFLLK
jgi:hypothetical protein